MTDRPAQPRVPRANPAPRRALPRVTPLGVGGTAPAAPVHPAATDAGEPEHEATGRDLLIPNGATPRRKGRGSGTVPTLAELMPPTRPAGHGKGSHAKDAAKDGGKDKHAEPKDKHHLEPKDKHHVEPKEKHDGKAKEVDLQVTLSKGLRKRLKAKAAEMGLTPEDAVAQLVEVWVDG